MRAAWSMADGPMVDGQGPVAKGLKILIGHRHSTNLVIGHRPLTLWPSTIRAPVGRSGRGGGERHQEGDELLLAPGGEPGEPLGRRRPLAAGSRRHPP